MLRTWDKRLARFVSGAVSPPLLIVAVVAVQATAIGHDRAWFWASAYIACAVFAPFLYLLVQIQRGRIADFDLNSREERLHAQLFTAGCLGGAWAVLRLGSAPAPMANLAAVLFAQAMVIMFITMRWKISVHCAMAAGTGVLLWAFFGALAPSIVGVLTVAWSRHRLDNHTIPQTIGGAILGFAVFRLSVATLLAM
jgi:hypothetical protein